MPRTSAPHGQTGRPPVTSRAEILAAARKLIDQDGWEKLTIRRLAGELGIGATTLYHHVRDKEDLLLLLITEYAGQVSLPDLPNDPRERIIATAIAVHDALAAWPWAADVLTTDGFIGRVGDPALRLVEIILAATIDYGCTPEQAVPIFRSIWYYTVGEILVRANSARRPIHTETTFKRPDAAELPRLSGLFDQWAHLAGQDHYAEGVRALVDGLLAQATSR
jgi:AcrR family transcriptional regulator